MSLEGGFSPCFGTGVFSGVVAMETGEGSHLLGVATKGLHNVIN